MTGADSQFVGVDLVAHDNIGDTVGVNLPGILRRLSPRKLCAIGAVGRKLLNMASKLADHVRTRRPRR